MNYIKILSRGLIYVNAAGNNWDQRKTKLISAWVKAETDYKKRTAKKDRINSIIDVLDERIKSLSKMVHQFKERQARERVEVENTVILLECPNFECRFGANAVGLGVRLKDYEHNKFKCEKCGSELLSKEDRDIDLMLFELGIFPL